MKEHLFLILFVLFSACSGVKEQQKTIELSNVAYDQFDLKKSHKILETALSNTNLQHEQKCEVLRKLALQDWKYHQNYALAKKRLIKADSIGNSKYDTWMLLSRIERESQHFKEALHAAMKAKEFAASENEVNNAKIAYAHVVYTFSENQVTKGMTIDSSLLNEASQIISASEPRLELAGMVTNTTGDYGHSKANKRIVDVAIEWVKEHKENISGYSDIKSAFSQIYLLTTNQIKECYKQADPLNQ